MIDARGLEVWGLDVARAAGMALCGLGRSADGIQLLRSTLERATTWNVQPARWRLHLGLAQALASLSRADESRHEAESALNLIRQAADRITDEKLRSGLLGSREMREAQQRVRSEPL
jgi:hypothetical protein